LEQLDHFHSYGLPLQYDLEKLERAIGLAQAKQGKRLENSMKA